MPIVYEKQQINLTPRVTVAMGMVVLCFFVIALRLWYLQIVKGEYFRNQSENNRLRSVYVPPPRGLVFDRNGTVLVRNRPAFNIDLVPEDSPDQIATVRRIAELVREDPEAVLASYQEQQKRRPFEPKLVMKDVPREMVGRISANRDELPGVMVNAAPAREYIYGSTAAHVLGYIREISRNQLENSQFANYRMGDLVGQFGVEQKWEQLLQGKRGIQMVVVNARGIRIGEAAFDPERMGNSVTLTLDLDVQRAADLALEGRKGAIVAMSPITGEIFALASAPSFDPNGFVKGLPAQQWQQLMSSDERALNNRATQGAYHPGSVFKIFMAIAGLSEGDRVMSTSEHMFCPGFMQVGSRRFRCHKHSGHGSVDHTAAMAQSCDIWFYTIGLRLGPDRIHDYATKFGFGEPTGLELGDEVSGLIPSTAWKKAYFKNPEDQKWYLGETPSVSIGQGAVTTTPLQVARALSAVVNGGKVLKPWLIKRIESSDNELRDEDFGPEIIRKVDVDPAILKTVMHDLEAVVEDAHGTGKRSSLKEDLGIRVAGKTGTAQVVGGDRGGKGDKFEDHAWFSAYAPAEKPEIVVVALVENGGHGGATAAPLVKQVMEAYFFKKGAQHAD